MDELFASIRSQTKIADCEVVFVDNGISQERAVNVRHQLAQFPCRTVYLTEPIPGIWGARKLSYQNAAGNWYFLLDDDNILAPGAIQSLLTFTTAHPEIGGICPRVAAKWEVSPPAWLEQFGLCCLSYIESAGCPRNLGETIWPASSPGAFTPPGGGMIIHRQVAEAFLYSYLEYPESLRSSRLSIEDPALYSHVNRLALPSAYVPSIAVWHYMPVGRLRMRYLTWLNFRMLFAAAQLENYEDGKIPPIWMVRRAVLSGGAQLSLPGWHPLACWLKLVRAVGYATGLWRLQTSGFGFRWLDGTKNSHADSIAAATK